jgi:hypothetical protein
MDDRGRTDRCAYEVPPGFQPLPAVKSPTFCHWMLYEPALPLVYTTLPPPLLQNW